MTWSAVPIGFLDAGQSSQANGTNSNGSVIVGRSDTEADTGATSHAFRWTVGGGMIDLGTLGTGVQSEANACSADGSVVVGSSEISAGNSLTAKAFRWTSGGGMISLGALAGKSQSIAVGCNTDATVIVGNSKNPGQEHPFRWTSGGGMVDLGLLAGAIAGFAVACSADGSVVVGYCENADSTVQAFSWTSGGGLVQLPFLPSGSNAETGDVSSDGTVVVGFATDAADAVNAAHWTSGAVGSDGTFGDTAPVFLACSNDATVRVGSTPSTAFTWTSAGGFVALPGLSAVDVSGDGVVPVGVTSGGEACYFVFSEPPPETVSVGVADLWFGNPGSFVDLTNAANRRKFVGGDGSAQNLGINGETPFGTAPAVFLTLATPETTTDHFADNVGSGGAFAVIGGTLPHADSRPLCSTVEIPAPLPSAVVVLSQSDDGARTWKTLQKERSLGKIGEYTTRVRWLKLGQFRQRVIMLEITDPVRRNIVGFYHDLTDGMG